MANITRAERERRAAAAQGAEMSGQKDDVVQEQAAEEIKFVKMVRDPDQYPAPHEAQVHPKEVSNFARGGWEIASE
ncbi:hypothetical protein [Burkholderia cepacia]|uniref:hypothetical protein n=1 Tax=Burkholderia cepacia TaxID=292 RepID=UPI0029900219|nr:hypothetical protein [Burkholderia cepacia]